MPKIVDRVERRAAIAAAAADAIADEGIEAVTMKGIAARAGVTTGAVTHYFDDKQEVILAALLFVDAAMRAAARRRARTWPIARGRPASPPFRTIQYHGAIGECGECSPTRHHDPSC